MPNVGRGMMWVNFVKSCPLPVSISISRGWIHHPLSGVRLLTASRLEYVLCHSKEQAFRILAITRTVLGFFAEPLGGSRSLWQASCDEEGCAEENLDYH